MTARPGPARAAVRTVWERAQMLIAFHRDPERRMRAAPFLWPPKGAAAGLTADPADREAFVHLRGSDPADDVQLKLRPNAIVARREPGRGWSGVEIDEHSVRVLVGEVWIEVGVDGTVRREAAQGAHTTFLENDGSIVRLCENAEIFVSGDGARMTRRTDERIDVVTADGVLSAPRKNNGVGDK
jgi:hypothetical protein